MRQQRRNNQKGHTTVAGKPCTDCDELHKVHHLSRMSHIYHEVGGEVNSPLFWSNTFKRIPGNCRGAGDVVVYRVSPYVMTKKQVRRSETLEAAGKEREGRHKKKRDGRGEKRKKTRK